MYIIQYLSMYKNIFTEKRIFGRKKNYCPFKLFAILINRGEEVLVRLYFINYVLNVKDLMPKH